MVSILCIFFNGLKLLITSINNIPGSAVSHAISTILSHIVRAFTSRTTPLEGDTKEKGMLSFTACMNIFVIATDMFILDSVPSTFLHPIKSMISGWFTGISHIIAALLALPPDFVVAPTASNKVINDIGPELLPVGVSSCVLPSKMLPFFSLNLPIGMPTPAPLWKIFLDTFTTS